MNYNSRIRQKPRFIFITPTAELSPEKFTTQSVSEHCSSKNNYEESCFLYLKRVKKIFLFFFRSARNIRSNRKKENDNKKKVNHKNSKR